MLNNPPCCAEKHLQGMARAASGYHKVLAENRILYNEVQDLKGVFLFCSKEQYCETGVFMQLGFISNTSSMLVSLSYYEQDSATSELFTA